MLKKNVETEEPEVDEETWKTIRFDDVNNFCIQFFPFLRCTTTVSETTTLTICITNLLFPSNSLDPSPNKSEFCIGSEGYYHEEIAD